jgi:hypothetical protein
MPKNHAKRHMHALTKASATHLLNSGHIDRKKHREIVEHAEKGMARARRQKPNTESIDD